MIIEGQIPKKERKGGENILNAVSIEYTNKNTSITVNRSYISLLNIYVRNLPLNMEGKIIVKDKYTNTHFFTDKTGNISSLKKYIALDLYNKINKRINVDMSSTNGNIKSVNNNSKPSIVNTDRKDNLITVFQSHSPQHPCKLRKTRQPIKNILFEQKENEQSMRLTGNADEHSTMDQVADSKERTRNSTGDNHSSSGSHRKSKSNSLSSKSNTLTTVTMSDLIENIIILNNGKKVNDLVPLRIFSDETVLVYLLRNNFYMETRLLEEESFLTPIECIKQVDGELAQTHLTSSRVTDDKAVTDDKRVSTSSNIVTANVVTSSAPAQTSNFTVSDSLSTNIHDNLPGSNLSVPPQQRGNQHFIKMADMEKENWSNGIREKINFFEEGPWANENIGLKRNGDKAKEVINRNTELEASTYAELKQAKSDAELEQTSLDVELKQATSKAELNQADSKTQSVEQRTDKSMKTSHISENEQIVRDKRTGERLIIHKDNLIRRGNKYYISDRNSRSYFLRSRHRSLFNRFHTVSMQISFDFIIKTSMILALFFSGNSSMAFVLILISCLSFLSTRPSFDFSTQESRNILFKIIDVSWSFFASMFIISYEVSTY